MGKKWVKDVHHTKLRLTERIQEYNTPETNRGELMEQIVRDWEREWPLPERTGPNLEVYATDRDWLLAWFRQWFNNGNRQLKTAVQPKAKVINLAPKKLVHPWQAYYYMKKSTLSPLLNADWTAHRAENPKATWISFFQPWVMQRLSAESDEVKAQVEDFRRKDKALEYYDEDAEARVRRFASSITKLPATVDSYARSLHLHTGMKVMIMVGGRNPNNGGAFQVVVGFGGDNVDDEVTATKVEQQEHTSGATDDAKDMTKKSAMNFEAWMGESKFSQAIQGPFCNYLADQYPDAEIDMWQLKAATEGEEHNTDEQDESDVSEDEENNNNTSAPKLSAYKREREKNIEHNRNTLLQVFNAKHGESMAAKLLGYDKKKKDRKEDGENEPLHRSTRLGQEEKTTEGPSLPSPAQTAPAAINPLQELPFNTVEPTAAAGPTVTATDGIQNPIQSHVVMDAQAGVEATVAEAAVHVPSPRNLDAPGGPLSDPPLSSSSALDKASCAPPQVSTSVAPKQVVTPTQDVVVTESIVECETEPNAVLASGAQTHEQPVAPAILVPEGPTVSGLQPHMAEPEQSPGHILDAPPEDLSQACQANLLLDASGYTKDQEMSAAPSKETGPNESDTAMDHHPLKDLEPVPGTEATWPLLSSVSSDTRWIALVRAYSAFESSMSQSKKSRMDTAGRPKLVGDWIKAKKKDVIPTFDTTKFGPLLAAWWDQLQPAWRRDAEGARNRVVPPGANWAPLLKGGNTGLYTIIVPLAWVLHSGGGTLTDIWALVDDIAWAMGEMASAQPQNGKRCLDDVEQSGSAKKRLRKVK
ncbi:hypothetical protein BKA70DRAFT_1432030 [Coprinopsis sp. MPI-PUGE-AT-0042]|nr:hypothetical protein BKA70DRAFT_1432030 [Coprinopsis sp. MPI-PUGE-AT-0042]